MFACALVGGHRVAGGVDQGVACVAALLDETGAVVAIDHVAAADAADDPGFPAAGAVELVVALVADQQRDMPVAGQEGVAGPAVAQST